MISTIEEAQAELAEVCIDVANDFGDAGVEAAYSDLVHNVAERCNEETAKELIRRELGA